MIGGGKEHLAHDGSVLFHLPEAPVVLALHLGLAVQSATPAPAAQTPLPRSHW